MEQHSEVFIGLDTSKLKISVAVADGERAGEMRFFGDISSDRVAVAALVAKLAKRGAKLHFCYEAGPTGYDLYRQIIELGHECVVVAPSLVPKRPGGRIKTNRRDALTARSPKVPRNIGRASDDLPAISGRSPVTIRQAIASCRRGRVIMRRTMTPSRLLKNFPAQVAAIRATLARGTPVKLWWQDEARVGQKNGITRRWARRGTRPSAPKDQRTASAYIYGAICPAKGKAAALVLPRCNSEGMALHLAEISTAVAPGAHAILLLDQAGWHGSGALTFPANITLLPLPSKCPELNPVENIWQFMRDNWLSNQTYKSYADILDHCCFA
jgi:transposase